MATMLSQKLTHYYFCGIILLIVENSTSPEWDLNVDELHRRIVDTGMFDSIPQPAVYETNELVVARMNGMTYHVQDVSENLVRIWFRTPEEEADKIVERGEVRPINGYAQIAYQIAEPTVAIEIDEKGHAEITRTVPATDQTYISFPGSKN